MKEALAELKKEFTQANMNNDDKLASQRAQLIESTESRIAHVRDLTQDIENTLMEEIKNLNETVARKDS